MGSESEMSNTGHRTDNKAFDLGNNMTFPMEMCLRGALSYSNSISSVYLHGGTDQSRSITHTEAIESDSLQK